MTSEPSPPALARRLLAAALPAGERDAVLGDLHELYLERHARGCRVRGWYITQALLIALRFTLHRLTGPDTGPPIGRGEIHDTRGREGRMGDAFRDLRIAARTLIRRPGFTVVAVLTFALGIGANTALFSVLYGALLAPLPYPESDELLWMSDARRGGWSGNSQSIPNLLDLKARSTTLDGLAIYAYRSSNFSDGDEADRIRTLAVTPDFFPTLGLPLALGRNFADDENLAGAPPVVVLSHGLWTERFGADPEVLGRTVVIDALSHTVIGVAPPDFELGTPPRAFTTFRWDEANLSRGSRGVNGLARLRDGVTLDDADRELKAIFAGLEADFPAPNEGWTVEVIPLRDFMIGREAARQVKLLAGAALLVLLIACANVANLLLARAEVRSREIAVRGALGAGRRRLVTLFLGESLLLAGTGALLGVVGAYAGVEAITALFAGSIPRSDTISLSGPALLFTLVTAVATGIGVGLVPALRTRMRDIFGELREGNRSPGTASRGLRQGLVVIEVALAMTLVAGAGLLLRSSRAVSSIEVGLAEPDEVLVFQLNPPMSVYPDRLSIAAFYTDLERRIAQLPGVESVGFTSRMPLNGGNNLTEVASADDPERTAGFVEIRSVNPGFFEAAGIPVLTGRGFEPTDQRQDFAGVVVTRELARQLWGQEDPLGRAFIPGWFGDLRHTVIGIAEDTRDMGPTRAPPPGFYLPIGGPWQVNGLVGLVRARGNPLELATGIRQAVRAIDPALPVYDIRLLSDVVAQAAGGRRQLSLSLVLLFGSVALVLGAVGIYGVMSYVVAQRSREMGVRIALGAARADVTRLVLGQGVRLTLLGIVLGVVGSLGTARFLESLLYGIEPSDPVTHISVAAVLTTVALVASWLPARRAARIDPLEALREE